MRHKLIAKEFVHLLKCLAFGLGEEKPITYKRDEVEDEEDVEVFELDGAERLRRKLCEDQVDGPVGEGCNCVAKCTNFDREDLFVLVAGYAC